MQHLPLIYQQAAKPFHPPWPDPAFTDAVGSLIRNFRPEVVHAHGWCAFSAASASRRHSIPIVVTLHDYGLLCPKKTLLRHSYPCETGIGVQCVRCDPPWQGLVRRALLAGTLVVQARNLAEHVNLFIAVSTYVLQRHLEAGFDSGRMSLIPNFADAPSSFSSGVNDAWTARLAPYFLFLGSSAPHKGREVLVNAYKGLRQNDHRLVLVGEAEKTGTGSDDSIVSYDWVEGARLSDTYRSASVVVVPSIWPDPCPTVALEAMSYGRPVIASAVGGLTDIVDHERSGLLVPPGDETALTEAMAALARDPARRRRMGEAALERATKFSTERIVPQIIEHYEQVAHVG